MIVMLLTFKVSFVTLWEDICKAGYWLIPIFSLWLVLYVLNALTWRIIIKGSGSCPVPFLRLLKVTITGFALNYATPAGLMGGEPYKIMEMKPYIGVQRATSSVLLFAMMHIFAHFWFWLTAVVMFVLLMPVNFVMGVVLSLIALFCLMGIYLFVKGYKNGMVVKIINFISKLPGLKKWGRSFMESHKEDLANIDSQISALQGQNKKSFYASFALEYIGRFCQCLEIYFMLEMFADGASELLLMSVFILAFTSLFANLLFFLPLQLGGREGGFAISTSSLSLPSEVGFFISIICRVRELVWTAIGLLLLKIGNSPVDISVCQNEEMCESATEKSADESDATTDDAKCLNSHDS